MKILRLTLKKKWFDMVASGEKKEEYREVKWYWATRLLHGFSKTDISFSINDLKKPYETSSGNTLIDAVKKEFDIVVFKNGYAKNSATITVEYKGLVVGVGRSEWGATPNIEYFVIKLGNIIN